MLNTLPTRKYLHFSNEEKLKLRDLNNLLARARVCIQPWICLTPNPTCFTPQRTANLGGATHGALGETEGWVLGRKPCPWDAQPCSEDSTTPTPGWKASPPWQPEFCTALRWAAEKFTCIRDSLEKKSHQGAAPKTLLLTMGKNCLALSMSQEPQEKVQSRRKGIWDMEWMDEWINRPRKQFERNREKLGHPSLETSSGNIAQEEREALK